MLIEVRHVTTYHYETPAVIRSRACASRPPSFDGQEVMSWSIVAPGFDKHVEFRDCFGNLAHLGHERTSTTAWSSRASGVVETEDRCGIVRRRARRPRRRRESSCARPKSTAPDKAIRDLARSAERRQGSHRTRLPACTPSMSAVRDEIDYEIGATHEHTSRRRRPSTAGKGVCQDHAHVFISAARRVHRHARPAMLTVTSSPGTIAPSEAHHAWAEAWIEGLGWVGFDPANGMCPTERYVRLACGFDAGSAAPIRGAQSGGENEALDVKSRS